MEYGLIQIVAVLAIAMLVAIAARRFRLPYTVGLVLVGVVLSLSHAGVGIPLSKDFIFNLILPPLLFEAALALAGPALMADILPILVLSTLGTLLAAFIVAAGAVWILGWPSPSALVFGALIAATDPVAIIAMFKDNDLKGRLRLLVEGESLFNDAAAAILFVMTLAWAQSNGNAHFDLGTVAILARTVLGGAAVGALCGGAAILVAWRTSEHLIEAGLTTVAAFGSFYLAEQFQLSGVLATVITGLVIGNVGVPREEEQGFLSAKGREFILGFWDFAAFLANSVIFLLIGVTDATMPFHAYGVTEFVIAIALTLLARALTVYPLSLLFVFTRRAISLREQHVLWWGGLRGALALALALSLPATLPLRDEIVVVTFGVVAFSVVVQGLTMPPLLRRLGFLPK